MDKIIFMENLTKTYRRNIQDRTLLRMFKKSEYETVHALKGINLEVTKGENVGYVGLNGAGKSTTIKTLCGILHPDSGRVEVLGLNSFENRKKIAQHIGVMFGQRSHLLWDLPLKNSLELLKKIYNIPEKVYHESIELANQHLGINDLMKYPIRSLSLGQRIRCEFTAITLHQPAILFLDEPTIGLDVITKNEIKKMLCYLNQEKQCTVFLTTHDLRDVERICDRVVVLNEGLILLDDKIQNVLNQIQDQFLSITFADMVVPDGLDVLEGVSVLRKDKNVARVKINVQVCPLDSFLKNVIKNYNVLSLNVEQPDLETTIVSLYESKKTKVVG